MIWWVLGVLVAAALVYLSVRTAISSRLDGRGAAPDEETARAGREAMRQIDRGRAAGQGMIPPL